MSIINFIVSEKRKHTFWMIQDVLKKKIEKI